MRKLWEVIVVCGLLLVLPHLASAQGTIAGTVHDESGAVIPGVTVQVSSPALIEGSREGTSDAAGQYSIVNLRPGTYSVSFTLTGFSNYVREGIVLEGSFAAQVNAVMKVGALAETVTVSGESPIVDVRSATPTKVLNRELMSALPAVRVLDRQGAMLPGIQVRIPVDSTGAGQGEVSMYGSKSGDSRWQVDGQPITFGSGGGGSQQALNDAGFEQVSFDDGAGSAEMSTGGVRINAIPKEGGNQFRGQFWGNYAPGWQADNLTQQLKDLNVGGTNKVQYDFDFGPAYGGPIKHDKLWFFGAYRKKGLQQVIFNTFTKTGAPWVQRNQWYQTGTGRLTWQASKRDKIAFHYEGNGSRPGAGTPGAASGSGPNQPPEASQTLWVNYAYQSQVKWTSTLTNRLLLETSFFKSYTDGNNGYIYREDTDPFAVSVLDSSTGKRAFAPQASGNHGWTDLYSTKVAASYVTGSHSIKVGMDLIEGHTETLRDLHRGNVLQVTTVGGKANSVTVDNSPFDAFANMNNDLGLFGQDTWTFKRVTVSGGLRFNWLRMSIPAQSAPAGNFVPARSFAAVNDVPNWKDVMPRLGGSWNVFGDGKTALKASVGKYVSNESLTFANNFSPLAAASDTRNWTDLDSNGSVFDTGTFNLQTAEIGPPKIANFGSARATARLDPNMKRASNWSYSVTLQRELFTGVSANVGYYLRKYSNCAPPSPNPTSTSGVPSCSSGVTRNLAVNPLTDYTQSTFVGPVDPRLPNGGGEVITFYNLIPSKLGATDNYVTYANNTQTYNGLDFSINARLPHGATLFGGITTGTLRVRNCDVNSPNELRFCDTKTPWQPEYKLAWNYPLPLQIFWSGTIRTYPGTNVLAIYAANSAILGVPLTGGGSQNIQLIDPATRYLDAVKAFDMRFSRSFRLSKGVTAQAFSDIINVPNLATIGGVTNTYGSNWLSPLGAPGGRFVRFGTQIDF